MKNFLLFVRFVALLSLGGLLSSCNIDYKDFDPSFVRSTSAPLGNNLFLEVIDAQSDSVCKEVRSMSYSDGYSINIDSTTILFSEDAVLLGGFKPNIRNLILLGMKHIAITDTFFRRAEGGCNTIIACEFDRLGTPACADLVLGERFSVPDFVYQLNSDQIPLATVKLANSEKVYRVPSILCSRYFSQKGIDYLFNMLKGAGYEGKVLAYADGKPIAITFQDEAGGFLTLVTAPLLFSNFGISYNHWEAVPFVNSILRQSGFYSKEKDKSNRLESLSYFTVPSTSDVWYEGDFRELPKFNSNNSGDGSIWATIFGELAKHILLILLLIFSVFFIRRRHQAIPLFEGYRNRTADYVRQVGVLYYDDGDLNLVLRKKVVFFFSEVADRLHIQLSEKENVEEHAARLAAALGCPDLNLVPFLKVSIRVLDNKLDVDAKTLAEMSDKMNVIVKVLCGEQGRELLFVLFKIKDIKD